MDNTSSAGDPTKELPGGFIDRLKEFIPEADDPHLYRLLRGDDPYSTDVLAFFEGQVRYLADKLNDDQNIGLKAPFAEWRSSYTPSPVIATVELYLAPAETHRQ